MNLGRLLAWSVHFYTALGLVTAAVMAWFLFRSGEGSFRWIITLMIIATFIDATDGTLARRLRVREVLPGFDGSKLDDLVDYLNYTFLPVLFIWRAELIPESLIWVLVIPLMASAYGFSQSDAKTDDHFFKGFPSYWNVVAIYLYWLRPPWEVSLALIIVLSILTFVPSYYLYLSYRGPFSSSTRILCIIWAILMILINLQAFESPEIVVWISLAFPLFYFGVSWFVTIRRWMGEREAATDTDAGLGTLAAETMPAED